MTGIVPLPADYGPWLAELKGRIHAAQQRAALAVNRELVLLYWQIGRDILARQGREGWGTKVIERLALDLRNAFPEMKGFSPRNLKYMRSFAQAWPDAEFVQGVLAQLPWYHQLTLLDKVRDEPLGCRPPGTFMTCCRVAEPGSDHGLNLFQSKPVDVAKCLSYKPFSFKWKPA